jgi:hypothetical protein
VLFLEGSDRATVIATASDGTTQRATTGAKGIWQITNLPAGVYHFRAECAYYTIVPPDVTADLTNRDDRNISFRAQRVGKK